MAISSISSNPFSSSSPVQNAVSGGGPAASDVSQLSNSLSAMSGGGAGGGGDLIGGAKAQYGGNLSGEQSQMLAMQEAVNRQSEAAAMMAALEKARHDAIMSIVQKIG